MTHTYETQNYAGHWYPVVDKYFLETLTYRPSLVNKLHDGEEITLDYATYRLNPALLSPTPQFHKHFYSFLIGICCGYVLSRIVSLFIHPSKEN